MTRPLICAAAAAFVLLATGSVSAASTPDCDTGGVINSVVGRFGAHSHAYLGEAMSITSVDAIREDRLEPRADTYPIERRYCSASVVTSDGERRQLWYLIEHNLGFVGFGSSVEYCVSGLDPWHVHGAYCQSLR